MACTVLRIIRPKIFNNLCTKPRKLKTCFYVALFFLPVVSAHAFPLLGSSIFWTNDDLGVLLWTSGAETGSPDFRFPAVGPLFGLLVSSLYTICNFVAWYPILLLWCPLLVLLLVMKDLFLRNADRSFLVAAFVGSLNLLLLGQNINFTNSAFLTSALSLFFLTLRATEERWLVSRLLTPVVVCALAMSIRAAPVGLGIQIPQPFLTALMFSSVTLLSSHGFSIRKLLRFFGVVAVALIAVLGSGMIINAKDQDWEQFLRFYHLRGSINGVREVDNYLANNSSQRIQDQTGLTPFQVEAIGAFEPFEEFGISESELRALILASKDSIEDDLPIGKTLGEYFFAGRSFYGTPFVLFILIASFGYSVINRRWRVGLSVALNTFLLLLLVGYLIMEVRLPEPAAVGIVTSFLFPVQASLVIAGSTRERLVHKFKLETLLFSVVILTALVTFIRFGWESVEHSANLMRQQSGPYRDLYRESAKSPLPIVVDALVPGLAFQGFPFDTSISRDYLESRLISGGSSVRSPQWEERFGNLISRPTDINKNSRGSVYLNSLMELRRADWVRFGLMTSVKTPLLLTGECLESQKYQSGPWFRLVKTKCDGLYVVGGHDPESPSFMWATPEGISIFNTEDSKSTLQFKLFAPFGEFSSKHRVLIRRTDSSGQIRQEVEVLLTPGVGNLEKFVNVPPGELISLTSISDCVVPFEVNPARFPDRRKLCFGIGELTDDGSLVEFKQKETGES